MTAEPGAKKTSPGPTPTRAQPGEQFFQQSIADLSRRLDERAARQPGPDVQSDAEKRRAAMKAYDLARARRLKRMLTSAGAVVATACLAWLVVIIGAPETPEAPRAASAQP